MCYLHFFVLSIFIIIIKSQHCPTIACFSNITCPFSSQCFCNISEGTLSVYCGNTWCYGGIPTSFPTFAVYDGMQITQLSIAGTFPTIYDNSFYPLQSLTNASVCIEYRGDTPYQLTTYDNTFYTKEPNGIGSLNFVGYNPVNLSTTSNTQNIYFVGSQATMMRSLPTWTYTFPKASFQFSYNQIWMIDGYIADREYVSFTDNQITKINSCSLTNCTSISFDNMQIMSINVISFTNCRYVSISNSEIQTINDAEFTNCPTVSLTQNYMGRIPGIPSFTNCSFVSLTDNYISSISGIPSFRNCQVVSLDNNYISSINGIPSFTNCSSVSFNNNQIPSINGIPTFTNCTSVSFNSNQIPTMGDSTFINCHNVSLNGNRIMSIETTSFINCSTVSLNNNKISLILPSTFNNSVSVSLNNNQLTTIQLAGFSSDTLQFLDVSNNKISSVDKTFSAWLWSSTKNILNLSNNALPCDTSIQWMANFVICQPNQIKLSGNELCQSGQTIWDYLATFSDCS